MGWLLWNLTRALALLAILLFATLLAFFLWLMLEVGATWIAVPLVAIGVVVFVFIVRGKPPPFDIRR